MDDLKQSQQYEPRSCIVRDNNNRNTGSSDGNNKLEPSSPVDKNNFFRCNGTGSVNTPTSSAHNTEDEDSDSKCSRLSYKERRREAHTQAEQKRRDAIKRGYNALQDLVPNCQQPEASGYKLSKASVLQRSIDYVQFQLQKKKNEEEERNALRKEVIALRIMKTNYEQIVKAHENRLEHSETRISDEAKFQVFQAIIDRLFLPFDNISVANFSELSACIFSWLEENCKPQTLREIVMTVLSQFAHQKS